MRTPVEMLLEVWQPRATEAGQGSVNGFSLKLNLEKVSSGRDLRLLCPVCGSPKRPPKRPTH